jgi:hypothetical protein
MTCSSRVRAPHRQPPSRRTSSNVGLEAIQDVPAVAVEARAVVLLEDPGQALDRHERRLQVVGHAVDEAVELAVLDAQLGLDARSFPHFHLELGIAPGELRGARLDLRFQLDGVPPDLVVVLVEPPGHVVERRRELPDLVECRLRRARRVRAVEVAHGGDPGDDGVERRRDPP